MANPDGKNAKAGRAVLDLVNAPPKAGLNNLAVTHKTNVADAFGKEFADIREGEALVYKTSALGPAVLITRVQPKEWIARAGSQADLNRPAQKLATRQMSGDGLSGVSQWRALSYHALITRQILHREGTSAGRQICRLRGRSLLPGWAHEFPQDRRCAASLSHCSGRTRGGP